MAAPVNIGGFTTNRPVSKKRLVVSLSGQDKCGKSHFALTAPGDIAYANWDTGLEGVIDKFERLKRIYSKDYGVVIPPEVGNDPPKTAAIAHKVWEEFKSDMRAAWKAPNIRTSVVDTEGETYEVIRLARFGKLTQVMPHHYGPVKLEYSNFYNEIFDTDKNLIFLSKLKEEYENQPGQGAGAPVGKKTGRWERVGMKDIPYMVQVNAIAERIEGVSPDMQFQIRIVNCRQNPELNGFVLPQPLCTFTHLGMMVYPGTTESDWI